MKKIFKSILSIATVAMTLASCNKEVAQEVKPEGKVVYFGTEVNDLTKASLTTEDDASFSAAWDNEDALKVAVLMEDTFMGNFDATWNGTAFASTNASGYFDVECDFVATYPACNGEGVIAFGAERTQNGNAYNGDYDVMLSQTQTMTLKEGQTFKFNMDRQTAIAYFHLTSSLPSSEKVIAAKLSTNENIAGRFTFSEGVIAEVKDSKSIYLTFTDAPSADDLKLWFNVFPGTYTGLKLEVETTTRYLCIENSNTVTYAAGKLYKVAADASSKYVDKSKTLTFNFVTHPSGWPVTKDNSSEGSYTYSISGTNYIFTHTKVGDGIYLAGTSTSSGYLLMVAGNKLGLPAINGYKLTKVVGTLNNQGSPSTSSKVSITDGASTVAGGSEQQWAEKGKGYTYSLTSTSSNTVYYLTVSNKNCQMINLVLTYEITLVKDVPSGGDEPTPLAQPTGLLSGTPTSSGTTLSWNSVPNAGSYKVEYKVSTASTWNEVSASSNSYTLTGLSASTTYSWRVTAIPSDARVYANSPAANGTNFTTSGSISYTKVTSGSITAGTYILANGNYVYKGYDSSSNKLKTTQASGTLGTTVLPSALPSDFQTIILTAEVISGTTYFTIKEANGYYIGYDSSTNFKVTSSLPTQHNEYLWTIGFSSNNLQIRNKQTNDRYIKFYTASNGKDFRAYTSSTSNTAWPVIYKQN